MPDYPSLARENFPLAPVGQTEEYTDAKKN